MCISGIEQAGGHVYTRVFVCIKTVYLFYDFNYTLQTFWDVTTL